jgi:hypothetical protein
MSDESHAQANESSTLAGATELGRLPIAGVPWGLARRTLRQGPSEVKPFADRDCFVIFRTLGISRRLEEFTLGPTVTTEWEEVTPDQPWGGVTSRGHADLYQRSGWQGEVGARPVTPRHLVPTRTRVLSEGRHWSGLP